MNNCDFAKQIKINMDEYIKNTTPSERFHDMVSAGIIDKDGRVVVSATFNESFSEIEYFGKNSEQNKTAHEKIINKRIKRNIQNKYKGLFVLKNTIHTDIAEDILENPLSERYEKSGTPIFNRSGQYYLKDGTHWIEDGKGMAIFYLKKDKGMRNFLINLHLASRRPLSDTEYLAVKKVIEAKLPGCKKIKQFFDHYSESLYLDNIRKGYNSYHSKIKYGKL